MTNNSEKSPPCDLQNKPKFEKQITTVGSQHGGGYITTSPPPLYPS